VNGADALLVLTEWPQYRRPDFNRLRNLLARPLVFDGRNLFDAQRMAEQGFEYWSVGRRQAMPSPAVAATDGGL
jgi:UDPglucose 6-dehydrogenase